MSRKSYKRKAKKRKKDILTRALIIAPFLSSVLILLIYGITERLILWLVAVSSLSWFVLTSVYLYTLITDKSKIISKDAYYKGKSLTSEGAAFFAYIYAVFMFAIGVMLAFIFFRELKIV